MIRTFVAIELPAAVRASLEKLSQELRRTGAAVSWVKPGSIHLTLKFLGSIPEEQVQAITAALGEVVRQTPPFRLQPAECGAFPDVKRMRVVWVGVRGEESILQDVQRRLEKALSRLGFPAENRPFKGHLTLGRVKGVQGLRTLQEAVMANRLFQAEAFDVAELVLYKSDLRPEGAVHTPLFRAKFGIG